MRTRKIRFYPTTEQKKLFHKCFGAHRFFYNRAIACINKRYDDKKKVFETMTHCVHCTKPKLPNSWCCEAHKDRPIPWKLNITLPSIRGDVMTADKHVTNNMKWQTDVPYDTRQLAIKDAITAYKASVTNLKQGNILKFDLKYQQRTSRRVFWMNKDALNKNNNRVKIFQTRLKDDCQLRFRKSDIKRLPSSINHDAKIFYDRGAYYLIVSLDVSKCETTSTKTIALDPGVRTFQTGYSPEGIALKIGTRQIALIKKLHTRIDHLRSVCSKCSVRKTRHNIKLRLQLLERKITGVIDDMHNQTISLLTQNFKTILLPTFGTQQMLQKDVLSSTVKRRMQSLCHYRFQQKLLSRCQITGNNVYLVDEAYTTQTCGQCGNRQKVGSDKVYSCPKCNYTLDRDIHGARNILIKNMSG